MESEILIHDGDAPRTVAWSAVFLHEQDGQASVFVDGEGDKFRLGISVEGGERAPNVVGELVGEEESGVVVAEHTEAIVVVVGHLG